METCLLLSFTIIHKRMTGMSETLKSGADLMIWGLWLDIRVGPYSVGVGERGSQ